ncbi:MAG: YHS domain-containing protein [Thermodesulfobacteriota bacterium]
MHPIRLLILAILFYILYRVLFAKKKIQQQQQTPPPPLDDTLEEDPVCHTYIPRHEALTLQDNGTTHYFCSEECRKKFREKS